MLSFTSGVLAQGKIFFKHIIDNGLQLSTTDDEVKRIRLLNVACMVAGIKACIHIISDYFFAEIPHWNILTHSISIFFILMVYFLQSRYYYTAARVLYLLTFLVVISIFTNFLEPGDFLEAFFLSIPILSMLFFTNKWINLFFFFASYFCYNLSFLFFDQYPNSGYIPSTHLILFFIIYFAFRYTTNQNQANELLLREQRNKAINDSEKIEIQHKELQELNRFQAHFLTNLSHEIRTPLTLLNGDLSKLKKATHLQEIAPIQANISKNTSKIQDLVDTIMDLTKMNSNKLVLNFDALHFVNFCHKLFSSFDSIFSEKKISFSFNNLLDEDTVVHADAIYLERALSNLIINASKYTPEEGSVSILLTETDNQATFAISDTGSGISKADLPHLFESFYQGNHPLNKTGGTGIGLSFAREVIELHRGNISVTSELDKGSVFTIGLPVAGKIPLEKTKLSSKEITDPTGITILLVEDNEDMRNYLQEILSNYTLVQAANGLEGLHLLELHQPDLIITDYMMPEMNGYEFTQELKLKGYGMPVIVLTARADHEGKLAFLRLGIDDYLTKPFHEEELLIRIQNCLKNYTERSSHMEEGVHPACPIANGHNELNKIQEIIEANYRFASFGVVELADELATTERTLRRKIKSWTGLSPQDLIREVKLQKARSLCELEQVSTLKQLALEVGFQSSSHFSKLYEKRFGKKPLVKGKSEYSHE